MQRGKKKAKQTKKINQPVTASKMSSAGTGEPSKAVGKQKEREQNVPLCEHAVTALWNVPENWDAVVAGDLPLR